MKKKLIKLTENDLHRIVRNSVRRIVKEDFENNDFGYDDDEDDFDEDDEFEDEEDSFYSLDVSDKSDELIQYLGAEGLIENMIAFLDSDTLNEMFDSIHGDIADGNL